MSGSPSPLQPGESEKPTPSSVSTRSGGNAMLIFTGQPSPVTIASWCVSVSSDSSQVRYSGPLPWPSTGSTIDSVRPATQSVACSSEHAEVSPPRSARRAAAPIPTSTARQSPASTAVRSVTTARGSLWTGSRSRHTLGDVFPVCGRIKPGAEETSPSSIEKGVPA